MKEKVFELYIQDPMGVKGDWFFLPMPENELKVKLKSLFKEGDYIIASYTDNRGFAINEYSNLKELNEIAQTIIDEGVNLKELEIVGSYELYSPSDLLQKVLDRDFCIIYPNPDTCSYVGSEEALGETLYEEGFLDIEIPQNLVDLGYIDFEAIGRNESINKGWRYNQQHGAWVKA